LMISAATAAAGSSPRRRGALPRLREQRGIVRIIPAQAGSTAPTSASVSTSGDHPRAGGEHDAHRGRPTLAHGSSPRRRGARDRPAGRRALRRIIPAQAGSTYHRRVAGCTMGDHPRAGGEHTLSGRRDRRSQGSSPRRRGARTMNVADDLALGIIPAQAGSTPARGLRHRPARDHPRAGGEHPVVRHLGQFYRGSSPRRRGARGGRLEDRRDLRIIPAQAGSTAARASRSSAETDHPRAGGEHLVRNSSRPSISGSSPRRRGARAAGADEDATEGIIPAQAGSTLTEPVDEVGLGDHPRAGGEHSCGRRGW